jgi:hypothetical protein
MGRIAKSFEAWGIGRLGEVWKVGRGCFVVRVGECSL